jgi:hypothetical protein
VFMPPSSSLIMERPVLWRARLGSSVANRLNATSRHRLNSLATAMEQDDQDPKSRKRQKRS